MSIRQAAARNALEPVRPPAGRDVVVATDLDRTFTTSSLAIAEASLRRVRGLRRAGVRTVLVTGRRAADLPLARLRDGFDAMVLEGGAVWGRPGDWTVPSAPPAFWRIAEELAALGHDVREGWASFSVPLAAAADLAAAPPHCPQENVDRIDVTLPGVDKASGLAHALGGLRVTAPWVLAVGDGANDLPLARAADHFVAVANADPALRSAAHAVAPRAAHEGFLWAVRSLPGVRA